MVASSWPIALIQQKIGWNHAHCPCLPDAREFAVQNAGKGLQPGEISFHIGGIVQGLHRIHEARHVEIASDVLDDHVWGIAPTADRDISIGQGETL